MATSNKLTRTARVASHAFLSAQYEDKKGNVVVSKPVGDGNTLDLATIFKNSGFSGGTSGGNSGTGGNDGGDDINPPSAGDDIYPGDVTKGEVTKRYPIWSGNQNITETTPIEVNQPLDQVFANYDGLQFDVSLNKVTHLGDSSSDSINVQPTNTDNQDNQFSTSIPIPISIESNTFLNKKKVTIPLTGNADNKIIHVSKLTNTGIIPITAAELQSESTVPGLGAGYTNMPKTTNVSISATAVYRNLTSITENADRSSEEIVVYKDDVIYSVGQPGCQFMTIDGLIPNTNYASNQFSFCYRNSISKIESTHVGIQAFTTREITNVSAIPATIVFDTVNIKSYSYAHGFGFFYQQLQQGYSLALFDADNKIIAKGIPGVPFVSIDGLDAESSYKGLGISVGLICSEDLPKDSVVSAPSITIEYTNDQSLTISSTNGITKLADGTDKQDYSVSLSGINTFKKQSSVSQMANSYLFVGNSDKVDFTNIDSNFDNIDDGLEICLVEKIVTAPGYRTTLDELGLPSKFRISKKKLLSAMNSYDLFDKYFAMEKAHYPKSIESLENGIWKSYSGDVNVGIAGTKCNLKISNSTLTIDSDFKAATSVMSPNLSSILNSSNAVQFKIASVKTYKEEAK
ncbi:hypothetical protein M5C72_02815 [Companilactobacillus allii]|uniref:Uncharacterized protein n=1 Tax=Companilactobacillus allii TaxID=1847728 RepID=A0A1P8Q2N2_9LACO|nr:hypothetical protein [Companilactobacillus allii]APX72095.1 hypothetical protein BTM29_05735 [Companilactobacillus allii]USQ69187.1 hypothetical protein M5C72_02815 [Companilactobacillus allii]